jgi:hypothetical protein
MAVATLFSTASLFLGALSFAVPATTMLSGRTMMSTQVRFYDNVGLSDEDRDRVLHEATQLLGTVSVSVTWRLCPAEGQAFCSSAMGDGERVVRIINSPGSPSSWEGKPLGGAVIDTETAQSVLATAYLNRTRANAIQCGIDPNLLLGRVIAHELRHVLAAEPGHGPTGLMREVWTCDEIRANRPEDWAFLSSDRSAIRRGFTRDTR